MNGKALLQTDGLVLVSFGEFTALIFDALTLYGDGGVFDWLDFIHSTKTAQPQTKPPIRILFCGFDHQTFGLKSITLMITGIKSLVAIIRYFDTECKK